MCADGARARQDVPKERGDDREGHRRGDDPERDLVTLREVLELAMHCKKATKNNSVSSTVDLTNSKRNLIHIMAMMTATVMAPTAQSLAWPGSTARNRAGSHIEHWC